MEAVCNEATIDRYPAIEAELAKWEARERRLIDQLEATKHDPMSGASDSVEMTAKIKEVEKQQNQLIAQLSEAKLQCIQLAEAKDIAERSKTRTRGEVLLESLF